MIFDRLGIALKAVAKGWSLKNAAKTQKTTIQCPGHRQTTTIRYPGHRQTMTIQYPGHRQTTTIRYPGHQIVILKLENSVKIR